VADLAKTTDGDVKVAGIVRNRTQSAEAVPEAVLRENDIVLLEGDPEALERAIKQAELELEGEDRPVVTDEPDDEVGVVEAVVGPRSALIGQAAGRMALHDRFGINLIAISRSGERFTKRLRDITLRTGDVVVLQGPLGRMPERLRELGCLPLAERLIRLGNMRRSLVPVAILAAAMGLTAAGIVSVGIAFFAAAALILLSGALPLKDAYEAIEWPIVVMLGALIPVSEAIRSTGGTELIAGWLSGTAQALPPYGALALIMVAAMAVTPFSTMPRPCWSWRRSRPRSPPNSATGRTHS
jgi:di/tricarboxylate transporter